MGWFSDPRESVRKTIELYWSYPGESELDYNRRLTAHLIEALDVTPKREAGTAGLGTNIDMYFQHDGADFLLSLKKGISEQKVNTILGEALILVTTWEPRKPGTKAHVF